MMFVEGRTQDYIAYYSPPHFANIGSFAKYLYSRFLPLLLSIQS